MIRRAATFLVEYLLSTSVPGTVLRAEERSLNKTVQNPGPCGVYILI